MEQLNHQQREITIDLEEQGGAPSAQDSGEYRYYRHTHGGRKHKKKMRKSKKILLIVLLVLFSLLLVAAITALALYHYMFGTLTHDASLENKSDSELGIAAMDEGLNRENTMPSQAGILDIGDGEGDPDGINDLPDDVLERIQNGSTSQTSYLLSGADRIKTFVLFGLDRYDSSDSIILIAVDPVHQKIKMISIARDTYVWIQKWGAYSKINYAYHWGGAEMSLFTLNQNLYLNLRDYAAVNFSQMEDIIDLVGGVTVELNAAEVRYLSSMAQREGVAIHEGQCWLNGALTVAYSRIRQSERSDNDEHRASRQRLVLMELLSKGKAMSYYDYPKFIRECMALCTTSFTRSEVLDLCTEVLTKDYAIEQYFFPNTGSDWWGGTIDGNWYYVYDLNRASDQIYRIIYEELYISGYQS